MTETEPTVHTSPPVPVHGQRMTKSEFYALPETKLPHELVHGRLIMSPAPNRDHQRLSVRLTAILESFAFSNDLGEVYHSPFDVELGDHSLQPDLCYFAPERMDRLGEQRAVGAPSLVVEILSPGRRKHDAEVKLPIYREHGVEELWLVDPEGQSIMVYRFEEEADEPVLIAHAKDDGVVEPRHFHGLRIELKEVFDL